MVAVPQVQIVGRSKGTHRDETLRAMLRAADPAKVPGGILNLVSAVRSGFPAPGGGAEGVAPLYQEDWEQLYFELAAGAVPGREIPALATVGAIVEEHARRGVVPIAITRLRFASPSALGVAYVQRQIRRGAAIQAPPPMNAFDDRRAFMAAALLPVRYEGFAPVPAIHHGGRVRFVADPALYIDNEAGLPQGLEIDFGDGRGARAVPWGQEVEVLYRDQADKIIRVRCLYADLVIERSLVLRVRPVTAPPPDATWPLRRMHTPTPFDRTIVTGTAWVVYGKDGEKERTQIRKPIVVLDGFPGGRSYGEFYGALNTEQLLETLQGRGYDWVMMSYSDGTLPIQANAGIAADCLRRTIGERKGNEPLVLVGASMGGLVARYLLTSMERDGEDHQVGSFVTFDTPNLGAYLPIGVQLIVRRLSGVSATAASTTQLFDSPAARQMLMMHVKDMDGPVTPDAALTEFFGELDRLGNYPAKVKRKLAVANGSRSGAPVIPPGVNIFDWSVALWALEACFRCAAATEPPSTRLAYMQCGLSYSWKILGSGPSIDGAPGGTRNTNRQLQEGCWVVGSTECKYPDHSFVPTVSAVGWDKAPGYYSPVEGVKTPFDEFFASSKNTEHAVPTAEIRAWLLARFE